MQSKIWFFGHFGGGNFGNEITLQAILHHVRLRFPKARVACICTGPETLGANQKIETFPISCRFVRPWRLRTRLARWLRRIFIGVPSEVRRWLEAFKVLKGTDMFIIPGTGLLTDAYGLSGWGPWPYNLFKWSLIARLRRSKVLFLSVGAGPIYSRLGKYFVRLALSLADFRSYRDQVSSSYLNNIGFQTNGDRVYPDLVFSLPEIALPQKEEKRAGRVVVGLGLMAYAGKYSVESPNNRIYLEYLESLVAFSRWLLAHGYDIRLLIGEVSDGRVLEEFKSQLKASLDRYDEERIIDEPASSVDELLSQIAATEVVVATRFHNVLLALVLNKPVIAISFHQKCICLMRDTGLSEYCHDINQMNPDKLIEQFQSVEKDAEKLKTAIRARVQESRIALDAQYELIFNNR